MKALLARGDAEASRRTCSQQVQQLGVRGEVLKKGDVEVVAVAVHTKVLDLVEQDRLAGHSEGRGVGGAMWSGYVLNAPISTLPAAPVGVFSFVILPSPSTVPVLQGRQRTRVWKCRL
jgi:hypothetical protein